MGSTPMKILSDQRIPLDPMREANEPVLAIRSGLAATRRITMIYLGSKNVDGVNASGSVDGHGRVVRISTLCPEYQP